MFKTNETGEVYKSTLQVLGSGMSFQDKMLMNIRVSRVIM